MIDLVANSGIETSAWLAVASTVFLKSTVLLALAFAVHLTLGRARVLARSAIWNACLLGLFLLPLAALAAPRLRIEVAPAQPPPPETVPAAPPAQPSPAGARIRDFEPVQASPLIRVQEPDRGLSRSAERDAPAIHFDVPMLATVAYFTVAGWLAIRLCVALATLGRLRRRTERVVAAEWFEALAQWTKRLGITRRVELLQSDEVSAPIALGLVRPAVILPAGLAGRVDGKLMDAVLVHELAHIRRGDFSWNLLRRLVQIAYWPQPLAWLAGRVVAEVREQACDDLCVHALDSASLYRASLLEIASRLGRRPDPALGLAMARSTRLGRRLRRIERASGSSRCLLRWPARSVALAAFALLAGALGAIELARAAAAATAAAPADQAPQAVAVEPSQTPEFIDVTVRAKDSGKPLAEASVRASMDLTHHLFKTDREGKVRIKLSGRMFPDSFIMDVWAAGYVQRRLSYSQSDPLQPKTPAAVVVDLFPGEQTLGGKVVDEAGKPIAGVRVEIWGYLGELKVKDELVYRVDAYTDQSGQWRCRCFREMSFAYLYLSHPDYLSDNSFHPRRHGLPQPAVQAEPGDQPLEKLRDFSDVQVMTRGLELSGKVVDARARPIAGAEVGWIAEADHDTFHDDLPTVLSDADGRFRFPHVRPGRVILQAKAKGHAPALLTLEPKAAVVVKMEPPHTLNGRVVDSKGEPVANAFVSIGAWRGVRSLGVYLKTDAEGKFRWADAPADSVLVNASALGYKGVTFQRVSPDQEAVFTLKRSISITGAIRDAKTKKRLRNENVMVELGVPGPKGGPVQWSHRTDAFSIQGLLRAEIDVEETPEFRLRITSKGYEPFESRLFKGEEKKVEYDVELTPAVKPRGVVLAGTVRKPDGGPLAGAVVTVTYPWAEYEQLPNVQIRNGKLHPNAELTTTKTDAQGAFHITREPDPAGKFFAVVVLHQDYYAEVNRPKFETDPTIVARPWGRVEGVARIGDKPAAGADIEYYADRLGNPDVPEIQNFGSAKADELGRFELDRVVPGDIRVSLSFGEGQERKAWSNGTLVVVQPGATAQVMIGGKGRPVTARIVPPKGFDPKADYVRYSRFDLESDRPDLPYPKELLNRKDDALVKWTKKWWYSNEGREYRGNFFRFSGAKLQPDGTIRVDDVPPGKYRLSLTYTAYEWMGVFSQPEQRAGLTKHFVIPPIPEGRSDEPFDLGELRPEPPKK